MIHTYFVGRIGKDARVITGERGMFLSIDLAVDNFVNGEKVTSWIRVRSNKKNHINLSKYLTKGRLLCCQGSLSEPSIWTDKKGEQHVQVSISADSIDFVSTGKKKDDSANPSDQGQPVTAQPVGIQSDADDPLGAPEDGKDTLAF